MQLFNFRYLNTQKRIHSHSLDSDVAALHVIELYEQNTSIYSCSMHN